VGAENKKQAQAGPTKAEDAEEVPNGEAYLARQGAAHPRRNDGNRRADNPARRGIAGIDVASGMKDGGA
jgi:hypothetical protein